MNDVLNNAYLALPVLTVLLTAVLALLLDLFLPSRLNRMVLITANLGLLIAAALSFELIGQASQTVFNGLLASDDLANTLNAFVPLVVMVCFVYSQAYLSTHNMPQSDFYVLGLLSTVGMMVLIAAHNLLTVYLGLELLSLPLYAMTALSRAQERGPEAAMKYFVMGAVASAMLLFGMSLLYGATGHLDLVHIAAQTGKNALTSDALDTTRLFAFALVFIVAGLGFKLAAVPFHMWAPDVYDGAPTAATLFIGSAPKIAAIGMTLRLLTDALPGLVADWQYLLLVMALLSTGLGNLLAMVQSNIKRLFAYSTVSHMGYALFGIAAATSNGYAAAVYYVIVYAFMASGAL
ncbi:MAG: NADH:ubiquinone oxidoreductase subunit N, partial [Legionella sp. 21-45-4]